MAGRARQIDNELRMRFVKEDPEVVKREVPVHVSTRITINGIIEIDAEDDEYRETILVIKPNGVIQLCELEEMKRYFQCQGNKVIVQPGCYMGD